MLFACELRIIGLLGSGVLLIGYGLIGFVQKDFVQNWNQAILWLVQSGILWGFALYQTWKRAHLNRFSIDAALYDNLGWGNRLTLLRAGLIAMTAGFLFQPQGAGLMGWVPGLLYMFAAILDRVDGFIARRTQQVSLLGNELDTVFDALGLLVAPLLAVSYGKIHWSYLLLSIAYYAFQWGVSLRRHRGLPIHPLTPSTLRRALAGFQMGFIALVLLPKFQAPLTTFIGVCFMLPVLFGFGIDWLVTTGRINSNATSTAKIFNNVAVFATTIFQPALRVLLGLTVFFISSQNENFTQVAASTLALILCAIPIVLGLAGRIGAFFLLILLGVTYAGHAIDFAVGVLIVCATGILLLGSGRFSLWRRDDMWINRHDGA